MTNAQSKCLPVLISCHQYVHPWTESCWNSAAGQIIHSLGNSSKIYTVVYMLSLLMRGRIPTIRDLIKTFLGIMQSTGFLATNGSCYLIFACVLRNLLGEFKFWTIAYGPAFIASFFAILVERPTRRPLLSLYVANLATETIWRMAEVRKIVRPIPHGETLIFGLSTSILLYLYKRGLHKNLAKDSLFNVLKFIVGKDEEGKLNCNNNNNQNNNNNNNNNGYHNNDNDYDADEDDCNSSNSSSCSENRSTHSNKIDNGDDVNSNNNNNNSNNNRRERSRSRNYSNSNNSDSEFYADAANAVSTDGGDDGIGIVRSRNLNESDENIEQGQQKRGLELDDDGIPRFYNNINYGDANDDTDYRGNNNNKQQQQSSRNENFCRNGMQKFSFISNLLKIYENYLNTIKTMPKHKSCPHSNGCLYYSVRGGLKLFGVGAGLQIALKLALQISKIIQFKLNLRKTVFNKNTIKLGIFLGGFSFLFKASSCTFRHIFGKDDPLYAIPAGLISSVAFTKYPDVTIALYVMWKMLQITYNMGIDAGYLPKVPGFTIFLYCASTATLFHAAALEAEAVRPSYWKFLSSNSGGRVNAMDRRSFDVYGLNSHQQAQNIQKLTNTANAKISFPIS